MTGRHRMGLWIFAWLAALVMPAAAQGAAGDLDATFSGDGKLTTGFGTTMRMTNGTVVSGFNPMKTL